MKVTRLHWIAVHEEVLGSKLRGFRKCIGCSEAEALGILTVLWLWARKNADVTGLLGNADKDDIAAAIRPSINENLDSLKVTEAMIQSGWIDNVEGQYYIHDWYEWQQYWYNYLDKKEKDKLRKRLERERLKDSQSNEQIKTTEEKPAEQEEKAEQKPEKPKKVKYAEAVSMQESEYQKLVEQFGQRFTEKLIEELDNYKVANGKRYKDDYRAILNWVVEKCEKKYPALKERKQISSSANPFSEYK